MNFVKSFEIGGVDAAQIPCITSSGAPGSTTNAAVGCLYMDTDTGEVYKCTSDIDGEYVWEHTNVVVLTDSQTCAKLGDELISANGWTTDGWTGNFADGFTHTSGNTNPLVFTMPEATGTKLYQVRFKNSAQVASMTLFVTVGNSHTFDIYGYDQNSGNTCTLGIQSIEDGNLQFIPTETFTGTISNISIKEIVGGYDGIRLVKDTEGNVLFEQRCAPNNLFMGRNTGRMNTTGWGNVGIGTDVLSTNTTGFWNIGIGQNTLKANTVGTRNIAIGYLALSSNKTGHRNVAIGSYALNHNIDGDWNVAIGADSLDNNTTGYHNVAIGFATLYKGTTAYDNVAVGSSALNRLTTGFNNVGVGKNALYNLTWHQNNTAIGHQAAYGCESSYNVCIGYMTGFNKFTGNRNILIGVEVNASSSSASNELNIGNLIKGSMASGNKYVRIAGGLQIDTLPTADPGIAGRLWNDNGTLKVSVAA